MSKSRRKTIFLDNERLNRAQGKLSTPRYKQGEDPTLEPKLTQDETYDIIVPRMKAAYKETIERIKNEKSRTSSFYTSNKMEQLTRREGSSASSIDDIRRMQDAQGVPHKLSINETTQNNISPKNAQSVANSPRKKKPGDPVDLEEQKKANFLAQIDFMRKMKQKKQQVNSKVDKLIQKLKLKKPEKFVNNFEIFKTVNTYINPEYVYKNINPLNRSPRVWHPNIVPLNELSQQMMEGQLGGSQNDLLGLYAQYSAATKPKMKTKRKRKRKTVNFTSMSSSTQQDFLAQNEDDESLSQAVDPNQTQQKEEDEKKESETSSTPHTSDSEKAKEKKPLTKGEQLNQLKQKGMELSKQKDIKKLQTMITHLAIKSFADHNFLEKFGNTRVFSKHETTDENRFQMKELSRFIKYKNYSLRVSRDLTSPKSLKHELEYLDEIADRKSRVRPPEPKGLISGEKRFKIERFFKHGSLKDYNTKLMEAKIIEKEFKRLEKKMIHGIQKTSKLLYNTKDVTRHPISLP